MITYDETKRQPDIIKHDLDFMDAGLVYDSPNKVTLSSARENEKRMMDIALLDVMGVILALVYVERGSGVRVISLRRASKIERKLYEATKQD